jgi:hypothetical protein
MTITLTNTFDNNTTAYILDVPDLEPVEDDGEYVEWIVDVVDDEPQAETEPPQ